MNHKHAHRPHPKRLRGLYRRWHELWLVSMQPETIPPEKSGLIYANIWRITHTLRRAVNAASWGDHGGGVFVTKWSEHVGSMEVGSMEVTSGLWIDGLHVVGHFGVRSLSDAKEEKRTQKESRRIRLEAADIAKTRAAELIQTARGLPYFPGQQGGTFALLYGSQLIHVSAPGVLKLLGFSREDAIEVLSRCQGAFKMPHPSDVYSPRCDQRKTGWNIHLMPD